MKNYRHQGFTLIELMIVIVILGLLAGLVAPEMFGKVGSSQRKIAATQMLALDTSLQTFRLDVGDFPDSLEELRRATKSGWDGPYIRKSIPLDPWGKPYVYRTPGEDGNGFYMASMGKDGQIGGDDDNKDIVFKW
ncbi:MAG: type II secretion system major pseudopilin GspG [Psychrosphaera sp.]|nr:type II secretion system major pseudopilin GspG [Psychrosphaera sp.]